MEDIAPKLLEEVQGDFRKKFKESSKIETVYEKIKAGTATYADADEFAIETGEILSQALQEHIYSDALPDGRMYYNIAQRILQPSMENNYNLTADTSMQVQSIINKANGIGIKAVKPELNQDRIDGIVNIVSETENFDDVSYMFKEAIVNFTQSIVDDAVRANADFQYKAGLSPKIRRTVRGNCCEWCANLAGTYEYKKVSDTGNDVFRRHKYCRCLVEFDDGSGKVQNVHTKKRSDKDDIEGRIRNSELRKKTDADKRKKRIRKAQETEAEFRDTEIERKEERKKIGTDGNLTARDLNSMSLPKLRETAKKIGVDFYKSGNLGVSFGGRKAEDVVEELVNAGNRTSLKKDILSMQKALRENGKTGIIKLPRYEEAVVPREKFTQYALNPDKDPDKAKVFKRALGFTADDADELIRKINRNLANYPAIPKGNRGWGETYEVVMDIEGKNGKTAKVLTAWIDDQENGEMRLTTAHVDD